MSRLDYSKTFMNHKKNLENIVDQQMMFQSANYHIEPQYKPFYNDKVVFMKYQGEILEFTIQLLHLNNLDGFFDGLELNEEEIKNLCKFLPKNNQSKELLNDILSGQNFHFGNPLNTFLHKLKGGYFTDIRESQEKLSKEVADAQRINYYRDIEDYFSNDRTYERKRRRRQVLRYQRIPEISEDEIDIRKQRIIDEELLTQSSQSLSPPQIQQVQPLNFVPSAQSLFNAPLGTQLPPFGCTSLQTAQITLALLQAKKSIKTQSKISTNLNESTIPTGSTNREWLEYYWKQERERYGNPLQAYTFTCIDGSKATVGPVAKKLLSGVSQKPRQHELLKNERPTYVTILSLVKDASARLPKGFGTRADIMNLVKDSQFINESLPDDKMSSIISGALDRLHQSQDPCVKYDSEKKIWIYLHHDRDQSYPEWQVATPVKGSQRKKKQNSESVGQ